MSIERLQSAFGRAVARQRITTTDVEAMQRAVLDGGVATDAERAELSALAERHRDLFEPIATAKLGELLTALTTTPTTPPSPGPEVVAWDSFSIAATRDELVDPEALATFDGLASAVAKGTLSEADQRLLASAAARTGVLGAAQALRAVDRLGGLTPDDRQAFAALAADTSPLGRAFLFEALAAGHTLLELKDFGAATRGWSDAKLLSTLNLADAIVEDGVQSGVKQQYRASCVPTTSQALLGEVDPVYALAVRSSNADINEADDLDALGINPKLAEEQRALLEGHGGDAKARAVGGSGTPWSELDALYNERAAQTGYVFTMTALDERPDLTEATLLDGLAAQLEKGIPTPLLVGVEGAEKCHAMLALEARGSGPAQRFLIHDPWSGDTQWATRKQLLAHQMPFADFKLIGGYHQATPAPAVVP